MAVLLPALVHGASLGTFDILSKYGLLQHRGTLVHNPEAGDQIDQMVAWTTLAWREVHQGHLPLWNPYSALGMPLAFNWQSGAFSLQAAFGYLFPVHLAYTVQAVVTLMVAGSGAYVFGRVLRLGTLGSLLAATGFELSGPVIGWLGWPHAAVIAYGGWWFGAGLLVMRGSRPLRNVAFLAVVVALAAYAGQPEILLLLGLAFALFCVVVLLAGALRARPLPTARPLGRLGVGVGAGACLAAPLLLPGFQLGSGSLRNVASPATALSPETLTHVVFATFDGLPIAGSVALAPYYNEYAAVVGVVVVVLAVLAIVRRWRQPAVSALGLTAAAMAMIVWVNPVVRLMDVLPGVGHVAWHRALLPLAFALAALGGVGADCVVRQWREPLVRRTLLGGFAAMAVMLAAIWLFGRGQLSGHAETVRAESFLWPVVATALGLAVCVALGRLSGREARQRTTANAGRWAVASLLAVETAFLIISGAPILSSSPTFFATSPAVRSLQRTVGPALVGFGAGACLLPPGLGIPVNDNVAYGVDELAVYDPMVPQRYFRAWRGQTGQPAGIRSFYFYCPDVTSLSMARLYGVGFLLEHPGVSAPTGAEFVKEIGGEDLYRVPGAAQATLSPLGRGGRLPPIDAPGVPVRLSRPSPSTVDVVTDSASPAVLRLRITDVPGWHATVDGQTLDVKRFAGIMLQVVVPAGRHVVTLHYWPPRFSDGLVMAALGTVGLALAVLVSELRRRRHRTPLPSLPLPSVVTPADHRILEEVLS